MVDTERKKDNLLLTLKIKIPILDNGMYGDSGRKEERSRGTKDWQVGSLLVVILQFFNFVLPCVQAFQLLFTGATMCRHNCPSLWNIMELLLLLQPKQSNNACTDTITVTQVWLWKFQIKGNTLCPQNLQVKTLLQMYTSFTCRVYNEILL